LREFPTGRLKRKRGFAATATTVPVSAG
jgi:hypothetical protein